MGNPGASPAGNNDLLTDKGSKKAGWTPTPPSGFIWQLHDAMEAPFASFPPAEPLLSLLRPMVRVMDGDKKISCG